MKPNIIGVAAVKNKAATTAGSIGGVEVEVMLDSGSSVSLVRHEVLSRFPRMQPCSSGAGDIKLVTASGEPLQVLDHVQASIKIGDLELPHNFVVVESLVSPVIMGIDFLHNNGLVLDFTNLPVTVHTSTQPQLVQTMCHNNYVFSIYAEERNTRARICSVSVVEPPSVDMVDECAVSHFHNKTAYEYPQCPDNGLKEIVHDYRSLFRTTPGATEMAWPLYSNDRNPCASTPSTNPGTLPTGS